MPRRNRRNRRPPRRDRDETTYGTPTTYEGMARALVLARVCSPMILDRPEVVIPALIARDRKAGTDSTQDTDTPPCVVCGIPLARNWPHPQHARCRTRNTHQKENAR